MRQEPIGPYFADFVCREAKLVVDVDGATHSTDDEIRGDEPRASFSRAQGYRITRVGNNDVYRNLDGVLETILAAIEGRSTLIGRLRIIAQAPHPGPLPAGGERGLVAHRASMTTKACASGPSSVMVRWMNASAPGGVISARRWAAPPVRSIVGLPEGRLTTPMSRQNTPVAQPGAQRLGAGLLGGEALGVGGGAPGPALRAAAARPR